MDAQLWVENYYSYDLWRISTWRLMNLGGEIDEASG